jgi:hypothetical protein
MKPIRLEQWPLNPAVIPRFMGIALEEIEGMSWTRQPDGQLISLTIHFEDHNPKKEARLHRKQK